MSNRRYRIICHLAIALLIWGQSSHAFALSSNEAALKVAFLYNFFKYINWPDTNNSKAEFTLCLSSAEGFSDHLSVLKNKSVNNKPLLVINNVTPKEIKQCQMLYINEAQNLRAYLQESKNLPIVTVSDQSDFIQQGGILGLIEDGNRLAFEVNLDIANSYGLHINSQLLKLAKTIITNR